MSNRFVALQTLVWRVFSISLRLELNFVDLCCAMFDFYADSNLLFLVGQLQLRAEFYFVFVDKNLASCQNQIVVDSVREIYFG